MLVAIDKDLVDLDAVRRLFQLAYADFGFCWHRCRLVFLDFRVDFANDANPNIHLM